MKKIFFIVEKSLLQHKLSTVITILSVALATALVMSVFSIRDQAETAFTGGPAGFDAVLGARGSQLQLVLNTVFHLETSPGNIPWSEYTAIKNNENVELAIPYAVGDNYKGYRLVGTTPELFDKFEYTKGKTFEFQKSGKVFNPYLREAVVGSYVAQKTGLKKGSTFNAYHGLYFNKNDRHRKKYEVTGVLKPTNSPSDRVIWVPINQFYMTEGHVLRGGGKEYEAYVHHDPRDIPDVHKEVSAVMLKLKNPASGFKLASSINREGKASTLAWPIGAVLAGLFEKIGWVTKILTLVAYIVIAVAAGSILASIYNTMNERRREFAILRVLGAKRGTVFSSVVIEAVTISFIGTIIGFVFYFILISLASFIIRKQTGVVLDILSIHPVLIITPFVMILLGAVAGIIPAYKAYKTEVASSLSPNN